MYTAAPPWHRPQRHFWQSGPWRLELRGDELAEIAYAGRVVLRSVRAVVRDADWNTAAWTTAADAGETLTLTLTTDGDLGCAVTGSMQVSAAGASLTVSLDATADAAFDTNRTGLVVLHPATVAGCDLTVTHPDGTSEHTSFPTSISPHQPAFDIAGLAWTHAGTSVSLAFSGDLFEMEDQRNWTDASYKTYSRPLSQPFPYRLEAGERVRQQLVITVSSTDAAPGMSAPADRTLLELSPAGVFPTIGVGAATGPDPAPTVAPLGQILLVELDLAAPTWQAALGRAAASNLPLDVRLVIDETDLGSVGDAVAALSGLPVARVAVFRAAGPARHVSDATATTALRTAMAAANLRVPVIGGARSHFTELSREFARIPADAEGIVFSTTPLFHSGDTEQLVESLAMQRLVADQAVRLAAGRPVHIGPVTLRPRFNDVATAPPRSLAARDLSAGYGAEHLDASDPRQAAPQLAAWTVASAAALAVPGVETVVFFEEWGVRGIRTAGGVDLPVAAAVAALADLSGSPLLTAPSPDGRVWAVGAQTGTGSVTLAANLDDTARTLTLRSPGGDGRVHLAPGTWARVPLA